MATHKYKSSSQAIKALGVIFTILILVGIALSINSNFTAIGLAKAILIFFVMFGLLLFAISRSYIEIDEEKRTFMYCKWPFKSEKVPADKIIQIGYPRQNYVVRSVNSFIYIWYDDPQSSGKDKYVKIKDAQFDKETLAQVGKELKSLNPKIQFDDEFSKLIASK